MSIHMSLKLWQAILKKENATKFAEACEDLLEDYYIQSQTMIDQKGKGLGKTESEDDTCDTIHQYMGCPGYNANKQVVNFYEH